MNAPVIKKTSQKRQVIQMAAPATRGGGAERDTNVSHTSILHILVHIASTAAASVKIRRFGVTDGLHN